MALFNRLLGLSTGNILLEDFFTEIVAYLLNTNKEILDNWLKCLHVLDINNYSNAHISTQRVYEPLSHHSCESRVDIVIELDDESGHDIIFIESKVGSQGTDEQLIRYAEILNQLPGFRYKFLLYITRDFDPKDKEIVLKNIPEPNVQFQQFRWHQFYQFLSSQVDTQVDKTFVQEIILFMEEKRMAHNKQFSSVDILALANFSNALKLMEEAMWGEVSQRFRKVIGTNSGKKAALTGFQDHRRYLTTAWMANGKWWCGLGFNLTISNSSDYPIVCLMLEVYPNSPHRVKIIKAMKDICDKFTDWKGYLLDKPNAYSGIVREKSLRNFLAEEDHVAAIQAFFLEALEELDKIKHQYPELPWLVSPGDATNLEDDSSATEEMETMLKAIGCEDA